MKTGTNKTAKGNPDTYFLTANDKYVFVMYTTQKDNFVNKALEDFEKCFDAAKTGLPPESVSEIVYCHTYGRLLAGEHKRLHSFCEERNAALTLIGLDELGNDLYLKYPRIAKEFLGISVDTGQIFSLDEFIKFHDSNKMSAPLSTEFLLREEELRAAQEKLTLSDVLILSGPAGVGKTKLALQVCKILAERNSWEVICIKSNGLELYEDLLTTFDPGKEYLVFVDDANELSGLHFVLNHLPKAAVGTKYIRKIIMSVRDYARHQVVNKVLEVEKPEVLKIGLFKDEEIQKLMASAYGITNHVFTDRIVAISEGNARLAMLAGKVASEAGRLDAIQDATGLYDHYYGKQLELISDNDSRIASAGIMAFFETLHLDHLESLSPLFSAAKLTDDQFVSDLKHLHDLELVDLCHDKAAKIADQSFSNYLIKHVFVDKKIISLSQMIETCFFINVGKTISACNVLLNVFSDKTMRDYVEQQINIVWDSLVDDKEKFFPFFKSFYIVRPTETLVLLKELIEAEPSREFDIESIPFKKGDNEKSITDDIISILCGFKTSSQLPEAIELLLLYYQKRPDLFEQLYTALVSQMGIDKDSHHLGYFTQKTVVEKIVRTVELNPTVQNVLLFIRVAERMLYLSFSNVESGRNYSVTFYTIPLTAHKSVLEYRKILWNKLYEIYEAEENEGYCKAIESLLMDCCKSHGNTEEYNIVKADLESIIKFLGLFSPKCLYHCLIAEHINKVAKHAECDCTELLNSFLGSPKYETYRMLNADRSELYHMDYKEFEEWHKAEIYKTVKQYSISDFYNLLDVCQEYLETVDKESRRLSFGLECAIDALSYNKSLYIEVVKAYLAANTPCDVRPYAVLSKLFAVMPAEEVKELIESTAFSQKNAWLWSFFVELPVEQVSPAWADALLAFLENIPQDLRSSPYRPLDEIEKFECVDEDIVLKASKVIVSHYEESPFVFSLYFTLMMNPVRTEAKQVIKKFESDIPLLEDIYQKCTAYSEHEDYDGHFLAEILKIDPGFLYNYLDQMLADAPRRYGSYEKWTKRLQILWHENSYLQHIDRISEYIVEKEGADRWAYSSVMGHLLLSKANDESITTRQDEWILSTIAKYYKDQPRMYGLFSAIDEHQGKRRRQALEKLLGLNSDFDLFEHLPLEASHWGGSGSMIPYMQERITYLTSILPMLSGIDYLKHKQKVERDIEIWRHRIRQEEIEELIDSLS